MTSIRNLALVASIAAGTLSTAAVHAQAPATASVGNPEQGKKLFVSYGCYQCHGYEGQGSSATGARLAPRPFPLQAFMAYVRKPAGQMPHYSRKIVPDADLRDIHAFLSSRPEPPAASSLPLLLK